MNFASALFSLKRGFKIKRKDWIGYWQLEDDKVMIHCKDGKVINLADSSDIVFTLENAACDDWEVITTVENVGLPYNPEVNKKDSLTMPVDKFYPNISLTKDDWWKHQPTCNSEKDECTFCLFDGTEWKPAEITKEQEAEVKLNDYRFCHKYKGKWIPWDRMAIERAEEKTMADVKTTSLSTAKKPVQESGVNIGTISTSEGFSSHNYEIYNKNGINSGKSTSVQCKSVVPDLVTEQSSVLVGRGITDAGDRKAVEKNVYCRQYKWTYRKRCRESW